MRRMQKSRLTTYGEKKQQQVFGTGNTRGAW